MIYAMHAPKVFISYSHSDATWARQFADALKAQGVEVWMDVLNIRAGERIQEKLERALKEADFLVSLLTPESAKSPNLFFELGAAVAMGKVVVPIVSRGEEAAHVPAHLQARRQLTRSTPKETARELVEEFHLLEAVA